MRKEVLLAQLDLWWRATRAPFLTASIMPVLLGAAVAYYHSENFRWGTFILTLVGAICAHLGANLLNDYGDHLLGSDARNPDYTPFSGGSRLIQNGILAPETVGQVGLAFLITTVVIGLLLIGLIHNWHLLWFGILGVAIGVAYSLPPFKLAFRGLGEIVISLAFGPLLVMGTYFVQTGSINWAVALIALPPGLLVGLILYINEIQDETADRLSQKNNLVVRINDTKRAIRIYQLVLLFCDFYILILIVTGVLPWMALLFLLSLPMQRRIWKVLKQPFDHPQAILPANALTIQLQIVLIGLLALALVFYTLLF